MTTTIEAYTVDEIYGNVAGKLIAYLILFYLIYNRSSFYNNNNNNNNFIYIAQQIKQTVCSRRIKKQTGKTMYKVQ